MFRCYGKLESFHNAVSYVRIKSNVAKAKAASHTMVASVA